VRQFSTVTKLDAQLKGLGIEVVPTSSYLPSSLGFSPSILA
jgi:hypothetical protein